jgi:hypothetical protein
MKKIFLPLVILSVLSVSFLGFAQKDSDSSYIKINVEDPSEYLPDYLDNVYFGMPLADFESIKDTSSLDISENISDMWVGVSEETDGESIGDIVYKFDKEENGINTERPLYQINIRYMNTDDEDSFLSEKFGDPQSTDSKGVENWMFKTDKDYSLIVNKKGNTVEIYVTMVGTEYEPIRK